VQVGPGSPIVVVSVLSVVSVVSVVGSDVSVVLSVETAVVSMRGPDS